MTVQTKAAFILGTWFGSGKAPVASGTFGSLAALPFGWALMHYTGLTGLLIASVAVYNGQAFTAIDTGITQAQFYKQEHFADAECSCFSMSK